MISKYKENNFSLKNFSTSHAVSQNNTVKPNIDNLIKKILVERKRERIKAITLGLISLSVFLMFIFYQNLI
jgi:hypothetical protein